MSRPIPIERSLAAAKHRIFDLVIEAVEQGTHIVVSTPPGVGKSVWASNAAVSLSSEMRVGFAAPSNLVSADLFARQREFWSREVERRTGVLAIRDQNDKPVCIFPEQAEDLQKGGLSVRKLLCARCPKAKNCTARPGKEGSASATVAYANHSLLQQAAERAGTSGLLVIDETPPLTNNVVLTLRHADAIDLCFQLSYFEQEYWSAVAPLALGFSAALRAGGGCQTFGDVLQACLQARPFLQTEVSRAVACLQARGRVVPSQPSLTAAAIAAFVKAGELWSIPPLTKHARAKLRKDTFCAKCVGDCASALSALRGTLCGSGELRWAGRWDRAGKRGLPPIAIITELNRGFVTAWRRPGPTVILDATPEVNALQALAPGVIRIEQIHVPDAAPVERVVLVSKRATRRLLCPGGTPDWTQITPLLTRALARAERASTRVVLLVSYTPISTHLADAETHPQLRQWIDYFKAHEGKLLVRYFGHIRGQNVFDDVGWAELDAVVTIGDPWPNISVVEAQSRLLGLSDHETRATQLAEAELAQAHGRLRAPRRTRPGFSLHVGALVPAGWHGGNTTVEALTPGPIPMPSAMSHAELERHVRSFGGYRALARAIGRAESSVRNYSKGARAIPEEVADAVRREVGRFSDKQGR